jgi:hypothetical protein
MKIIYSLSILLLVASSSFAQNLTYEPPKNYTLIKREDYAVYNMEIIEASKWLEETPIQKEAKKRKEVNKFVIKWLAGSPEVTINITDELRKIIYKNDNYMAIYFATYSKDVIANKESTAFSAAKAACTSLIKAYLNSDVKSFPAMEKLVEAYQSNKLDSYIMENF